VLILTEGKKTYNPINSSCVDGSKSSESIGEFNKSATKVLQNMHLLVSLLECKQLSYFEIEELE